MRDISECIHILSYINLNPYSRIKIEKSLQKNEQVTRTRLAAGLLVLDNSQSLKFLFSYL